MSDGKELFGDLLSQFRGAAQRLLEDKRQLLELLDRATTVANRYRVTLKNVWEDLQSVFRLLRAWATGMYEETPWHTLIAMVSVVVYVALALGGPAGWMGELLLFTLEVLLLEIVLHNVKEELSRFHKWETAPHAVILRFPTA